FHPFHSAPADLPSADFRQRLAALFEACLGRLEDGSYRDAIRCRYRDKFGMQSPFVYWELLGEELLEQALDCLPAAHLRAWFERLLEDIPGNRAGQNWIRSGRPAQRRYR
ncbi:VRR-NUC domain-containing protein, partial [Pseudomonas aeruginosa]